MKYKISISVDEETLLKVKESLRQKALKTKIRNKSHLFELAVNKYLEELPK